MKYELGRPKRGTNTIETRENTQKRIEYFSTRSLRQQRKKNQQLAYKKRMLTFILIKTRKENSK